MGTASGAGHGHRLMPRSRWAPIYAAVTAAAFLAEAAVHISPGPAGYAVLVLQCVPLAWQRDRPLEAALGVNVMWMVVALVGVDTSIITANFGLVFGPAFCVGRFEPRGRAIAGLASFWLAYPIADALIGPFDPSDFVALILFVTPAWGLGRVLLSRAALAEELAAVNAAIAEEREAHALDAVAQERARIARELHDIVAHALSVMVLQAAGARLAVTRDPDASVGALEVVEQAGRDAVSEMGRLLGVLHGDGEAAGGLARLDELVERARLAGLALEVSMEGSSEGLAPTIDLTAYRIAQEAVTNAVKHAAPTRATLSVRVSPDALDVVVEDEGHPERRHRGEGTGHGLLGMRERAELHGGKVEAAAMAGGGFRVHARLPVA
jgi:signal transduction histidine kinase